MKFSSAFQPIVDLDTKEIFSYEALVRGQHGEPASTVFSQIEDKDLLNFDQEIRKTAIRLAAQLNLSCRLNLNFIPRSFNQRMDCVSETLEYAKTCNFDPEKIIIEITEQDIIYDLKGFSEFIMEYRSSGNLIAIDDFGAGYSGLNMLIDFLPDIIKLDMNLINNIHSHGRKQALVRSVMQLSLDLGIDVIAEGIESFEEFEWLRSLKINLYQGHLFNRPGFECLPMVSLDAFY